MMAELRSYPHHGATFIPPAGSLAKPPTVHPKGRKCEHEDCEVVLGIYNAGPNCYQHTERKTPRNYTGHHKK